MSQEENNYIPSEEVQPQYAEEQPQAHHDHETPTQTGHSDSEYSSTAASETYQQNNQVVNSMPAEYQQQEAMVESSYSRGRKVSRIDQENPFLQNLAQELNIMIEVTGYKFLDSNISKYAVFTVVGNDKSGDFETTRRYSDFHQLRLLMIKRWPGCFIPPLPSKKAIGNTDHSFLNERKKYLHTFCNRIAKLGYLYYSVEFQLFLRHKDSEISKKLTILEDCQVITIIEKYKGQFSQLAGQEVTPEVLASIQSFHGFLKVSLDTLRDQRQSILELVGHKKNTDLALRKFQKYTIQKYEYDMLSQYTNGKKSDLIYTNEEENSELQQIIEEQGEVLEMEPFTLLYDLINHELKDTQAFIDAMESKEYFENRKKQFESNLIEKKTQLSNLENGKKTLRSIFTKGDANQQKEKLTNDIAFLEQEIQYNAQLNEIIIGIVGMIEIEKYKQTKAKQYYEVMTTVSRLELECLNKQQRLWTIINQVSQQKLENFTLHNSVNQSE